MKANIKTAARLAARLESIDRNTMADVSGYSHAAAATDRAASGSTRDRAIRDERAALNRMLETVNDNESSNRRAAVVAELESAGLTSNTYGGWAHQRAGRWMVQTIRDLEIMRTMLRQSSRKPAECEWAQSRADDLIASLESCGVDCTGYLPVA